MPRKKSKISDIKPNVTGARKAPARKAAPVKKATAAKVNGSRKGLDLAQRKQLRAELAIKRREAAGVKKAISEHNRETKSLVSARSKELKLLDRDWNNRTREIDKMANMFSG